jgi:hypothetical protein
MSYNKADGLEAIHKMEDSDLEILLKKKIEVEDWFRWHPDHPDEPVMREQFRDIQLKINKLNYSKNG